MLDAVRRRVRALVRWYQLRERALVLVTWLAVRILPARRIAVVHGWPDSEGNAVEVLRQLVRRYPGTIYWLRNPGTMGGEVSLGDVPPGKVVNVRVNTLAAFRASWRAEVTFFTHGLMTAVRPPRSRLVVNLWHGDGPKAVPGLPRCASTVVVAATDLWGREKARLFGLRDRDVAVVGNPRVDSALRRLPAQTRRQLGLADDESVVLWLPTFRRGWDGVRVAWSDGDPLSESVDGRIDVPDGVMLIVKPHPFDTDDYTRLGARVLTNRDLTDAGVTLPQLMAASDALISDASSAWVDFLGFDRPVGFFLPDVDRYGDMRGYNVPDLFEVLPGPVLVEATDVSRFLVDVRAGRIEVPSTHPALARIGYRATAPVTEHLLIWLDEYQRARGARPLFASHEAGRPTDG
jgi:hypothetical protein